MNKTVDIVVLGQTHLHLHGQQFGSTLSQTRIFKKHVGGLGASIAVGCSRLALNTALFSFVGNDCLGQSILDSLEDEQLDCTQVARTAELTPLCLSATKAPLSTQSLSYESPELQQDTHDIDLSLIANANTLIITECALRHPCFTPLLQKCFTTASVNQTKRVLVLQNASAFDEAFDFDIIIGKAEHIHSLRESGIATNTLIAHHPEGCTVYTRPQETWCEAHYPFPFCPKQPCHQDTTAAYVAGFIKGFIKDSNIENACHWANLAAAITMQRNPTLDALPLEEEIELLSAQSPEKAKQTLASQHFAHLHYAGASIPHSRPLYAFNFGYHEQWLKMAQSHGISTAAIERARHLIAKGLNQIKPHCPHASVISDDSFEQPVKELFGTFDRLIRSVEVPGEIPVQYKSDPDITRTLLNWPSHHIAKVSLTYHPDDRYALRAQQEATLHMLYHACQTTEHPLIIEIVPSLNSIITSRTMAHIMLRFYEMGIYPDWWQMQPPRDQKSYHGIIRTIEENDPHCKGVLINTQHVALEHLDKLFEVAAIQPYCNGFVFGHGLFKAPLEQWLAQKISDEIFINEVSHNFKEAVALWKRAKSTIPENDPQEAVNP